MAKAGWIRSILLTSLLLGGCVHEYRVYDPYRGDYHRWDRGEDEYYRRWARETHHENRNTTA